MERSRRRRAITPDARKRLNRRRRASTALTTLMVAGPAGQVLAATGGTGERERPGPTSSVDRAIGAQPGGLMLKAGSTGAAVQAIQERLGVPADGVYGPVTEGAVRDFQVRTALQVDGIVGPITWTKLFGLDRAAASAGAARGDVAVIVREREPADRGAGRTVRTVDLGSDRADSIPAVERTPSAAPPIDPVAQAPAARPAPTSGACGTLRLASPVTGVRTSPFGPRWGRNHDGIDLAAATGTPVRAAECGVVSVRGVQSGYGNMVCVQHSDRFETCYAHLSSFAVNGGQTVRRGQVIGYVGCTGSCTGPHLHFETRVDGQAHNPDAYLRGASVPGKPKVSQASHARTARAQARPVATESEWQAATPASQPESAASVQQVPVAQSTLEPVEQPAPVAQVAPAPVPVEPVVAEPAPAPVVEAPVAEPVPEAPVAEAPVEAPAPAEPIETPTPAPAEPAPVEPELPTPAAEVPAPVEPEAIEAPVVEPAVEPAPVEEMVTTPEAVPPAAP